MITIQNKQRNWHINKNQLHTTLKKLLAATRYDDFDIGLLVADNKLIQYYNQQYRGIDKPTDVLSFPFYPNLKPGKRIKTPNDEEWNLGDIIISPAYVVQQFKEMPNWKKISKSEQKKRVDERITVLLIHGLCHLLGYDHETDAQYRSMHRKELQLRRKLR